MITITIFFLSIYLIRNKLKTSLISVVFLVSVFVKVVVSFYFYDHMSVQADALAALAIGTIIILSAETGKRRVKKVVKIAINVRGVLLLLFLAQIFFIIPCFIYGTPPPLVVSIFEGYLTGHDLRIFYTKEHELSLFITVSGKLVIPLCVLALGLVYSQQTRKYKRMIEFFVFTSVLVTSAYLQKALPITTMLTFFLGLLLTGNMGFKKVGVLTFFSLSMILLFSRVFVESWSDSLIKFNDLMIRRLGDVPADVYQHYIMYKNEYGMVYLQDSFGFITKTDLPLPIRIYHYMGYGNNQLGWANGFFVGDVFVNFGIVGVVIISLIIAKLIRMGNVLVADEHTVTFFTLVKFVSISSLCFYLPSNAFFSGTIFFFIITFVGVVVFEKYFTARQGGRSARSATFTRSRRTKI